MMQTAVAEATNPPNILVILADDMGYSDLGCMGAMPSSSSVLVVVTKYI